MNSDENWVAAIEAADERGDLGQLAKLLRAGIPLSDDAREMLADLLADRKLSRARRRTAYQTKLLDAAHVFRMGWGKQPDETRDEQIERVARERGVPENKLREVIEQRGRLSQRIRRRS